MIVVKRILCAWTLGVAVVRECCVSVRWTVVCGLMLGDSCVPLRCSCVVWMMHEQC